MNEASKTRRRADIEKLRELQTRMRNTLEIIGIEGEPPRLVKLRIRVPTAKNVKYPQEKQDVSEVNILFSENYPFPPGPTVNFTTQIWNPNVYPNGKWCFGEWKVTENLELFVIRLIKVIAIDPTIVNPKSPANTEAARWYVELQRNRPELFPTVSISGLMTVAEKPKIVWRSIK